MALLNALHRIRGTIQRSLGVIGQYQSTTSTSLSDNEADESKKIIDTCNELANENNSRSFAIVHLLGKQWKVTDGDIIMVEGYWPPNIGDKMNLDKVLLAGTKDFSLIGRPLVQPGLVQVTATVISKALSPTRTHFRKKRRKQYMRINFQRLEQTMLRINSVNIRNTLNSPKNVFQ